MTFYGPSKYYEGYEQVSRIDCATIKWLRDALDIRNGSSNAVCLVGGVGAGKSCLASSFVCSLLDDGMCEGNNNPVSITGPGE